MSVEVEKEMLNAIFAARDEEYADFTAKLIPNVPRESIIGVRTPPQHCKTVREKCGN